MLMGVDSNFLVVWSVRFAKCGRESDDTKILATESLRTSKLQYKRRYPYYHMVCSLEELMKMTSYFVVTSTIQQVLVKTL